MKFFKLFFIQVVVTLGGCLLALVATEFVLRLKNASMTNYDIEMWRYAKTLKTASVNPVIGHEHLPNRSETLQSVLIRTNSLGMRGPEPRERSSVDRRLLFLGSSITLGWGVPEEKTFVAQVEDQLKTQSGNAVEALNAGIGNYNTVRYVELFFDKLAVLNPDDIVVTFFLRDAETLSGTSNDNWLLRNSQLAVVGWMAFQHRFGAVGSQTLEEHYKKVFNADSQGFKEMVAALERLSNYSQQKGIRIYLATIPDIHSLKNYSFGYAHDMMAKVASELKYDYLDLYPPMSQLEPQEIWAMPGDPHPNTLGHTIMAKQMAPWLASPGKAN